MPLHPRRTKLTKRKIKKASKNVKEAVKTITFISLLSGSR